MTDKKITGDKKLAVVKSDDANPIRAAYLDRARKAFFDNTLPARTAKATAHVTLRAQTYGLRPLEAIELRSIYALFAWVANEQHAAEETVQGMTEARFGVSDITRLRQKDYDDVIKFLVDLRLDELKN